VPVRVEPVRVGDFPLYYKALGTVTATNTVNVRSRVAGELVKIHFQEGQQVKAGDLLAEIDPRPYRIALQQAEGTLAQNQAQLKNAQVDLARYKGLYAEDSIAKQTLDTAEAQVAQFQGLVKTNQAAGQRCPPEPRFHPDPRTDQRPPGPAPARPGQPGGRQRHHRAGGDHPDRADQRRLHPAGNRAGHRAGPLPQRRQPAGRSLGPRRSQAAGHRRAGQPRQPDRHHHRHPEVQGPFENKDQALFPNQFVNVRLLADTLKQVVLAPAAAIQFGNDGTFVYVVNQDSKVNIRKLKVGASDGQHSVILEGLSAGDRLVLEGTDRLREGTKVEVVEDSSQVPTTPASTCRARTPRARHRPPVNRAGKAGA
jgi:multidrug efflux system membrane fusion protein